MRKVYFFRVKKRIWLLALSAISVPAFRIIPVLNAFDLCPACSPEIVAPDSSVPGFMLGKRKFSLIGMAKIETGHKGDTVVHQGGHQDPEAAIFAFNYGITDRFKAGAMYGLSSGKLSLQVDFLLIKENDKKPGLILGSGSFRGIFSESHPYIIATKNMERLIKLPVKISAGLKHSADDFSKLELGLAGHIISRVYKTWHLMAIFEGATVDLAFYGLLFEKYIVGLRLIELKTPAVGVVFRM